MIPPGLESAFWDAAAVTFMVMLIALVLGALGQRSRSKLPSDRSISADRATIRRGTEWCEIVAEHDDGYGVAVAEEDSGVSIKSFNGADEVYQDVWLRGEELADVADALSVRAVEKAEQEGKWRVSNE